MDEEHGFIRGVLNATGVMAAGFCIMAFFLIFILPTCAHAGGKHGDDSTSADAMANANSYSVSHSGSAALAKAGGATATGGDGGASTIESGAVRVEGDSIITKSDFSGTVEGGAGGHAAGGDSSGQSVSVKTERSAPSGPNIYTNQQHPCSTAMGFSVSFLKGSFGFSWPRLDQFCRFQQLGAHRAAAAMACRNKRINAAYEDAGLNCVTALYGELTTPAPEVAAEAPKPTTEYVLLAEHDAEIETYQQALNDYADVIQRTEARAKRAEAQAQQARQSAKRAEQEAVQIRATQQTLQQIQSRLQEIKKVEVTK